MSVGKAKSTGEIFNSRSDPMSCLWALESRLQGLQAVPNMSPPPGAARRASRRYQGKLVKQ